MMDLVAFFRVFALKVCAFRDDLAGMTLVAFETSFVLDGGLSPLPKVAAPDKSQ